MDTQQQSYSRLRAQIMASFLNTQKSTQDPSQSSVCRCLFGPGDPELNKRVARESLKAHEQQMSAKYNFDFATETPKKGDYEWEKENDVPEVYTTVKVKTPLHSPSVTTSLTMASRRLTSKDTMTSPKDFGTSTTLCNTDSVSSSQDTASTSQNSESTQSGVTSQNAVTSSRKRQMEITDYFHAKKSKSATKRRLDL